MKTPIPRSDQLLDRLKQALTPDRLPLLIAVDGADGVGKSSLARGWRGSSECLPSNLTYT